MLKALKEKMNNMKHQMGNFRGNVTTRKNQMQMLVMQAQ